MNQSFSLKGVVFGIGFLSMLIELLGLSVVAPFFGTSLTVTSNLIGVVLAGLSVGYLVGGRLADREPSLKKLSRIILWSSILFGALFSLKDLLSGSIAALLPGIAIGSLVLTIILFGPLMALFGMVLPYAIRMSALGVSSSGKTSGSLYGISTAGGVLGTLLAGFVVLPYVSLTLSLIVTLIALVSIAALAHPPHIRMAGGFALLFAMLLSLTHDMEFAYFEKSAIISDGSVSFDKSRLRKIADATGPYGRDQVYEGVDLISGKPIRLLRVNRELHSGTFLDSNELIFNYAKFNELGGHFNPDAKKALLIGGGGYSYPKFFLGDTPLFDVETVWEFQGEKYSNNGKLSLPFTTSYTEVLETPRILQREPSGNDAQADLEGSKNFLEVRNQLPSQTVLIDHASIHETGLLDPHGFVHVHEVRDDGEPGAVISPNIPIEMPGNVIGHSDLIANEANNITIPLDRESEDGEVLYAMLHRDNGNGRFDAILVDGYSKIREMHVVEIDPKTTALAEAYMGLDRNDARLTVFHEDGRTFINRAEERYDIIYLDVFRNFYTVPFQLTTIEAVTKLHAMLNENGVIVVNIPSALQGTYGKFFQAEYRTYKEVFPEVHAYAVSSPEKQLLVQNIVLIGFKTPETIRTTKNLDEAINERLAHRWKEKLEADAPLLTDEYAPTDFYINLFANLHTL